MLCKRVYYQDALLMFELRTVVLHLRLFWWSLYIEENPPVYGIGNTVFHPPPNNGRSKGYLDLALAFRALVFNKWGRGQAGSQLRPPAPDMANRNGAIEVGTVRLEG